MRDGGVSVFTVGQGGVTVISGAVTIVTAACALDVQNTVDAASNQVAVFRGGNRATPTDNDEAYISFTLDNDGGVQTEAVRLTWIAKDVTAATFDAQLKFGVATAGGIVDMLLIDSTAVGVITTTIPVGDVILADNVSLKLGTGGAESDLSSNGTNTIWNMTSGVLIFQANGTEGYRFNASGVSIYGSGEGGIVAATGQLLRSPDATTGGLGNVEGTDFTCAAGIGTGIGDVGTFIVQLPIVAAAGDFIQTRATRLTLDMAGSTTVLSMTAAQSMTISCAAGTLTITSPAITSPVLTTPQINDTSSDHQYIFAVSELLADRTVTLPLLIGDDEFVFKAHAATLTNKTLTSPDINGGTVDTITSLTVANDVDIGAFGLRAATLTADGLTATRVVFAGVNGLLSDDADFTFSVDTLTVTKIGAFQAAGAIDFDSQNMTNVDIDSGDISGVTVSGCW